MHSVHPTALLLTVLGGAALLLWGVRMVRTGATRAFGSALRRLMGRASTNRTLAFFAGLIVTALIQSSTATALIVASFAARGQIALPAAIIIMLGAGIGTTVAAQFLSFDVNGLWPIPMFLGTLTFMSAESDRARGIARMAIGIALMLLSLSQISGAAAPLGQSETFRTVMGAIGSEPIIAIIVAALVTWMMHSSLAFVLIVMALAGTGAVTAPAALALVIGANIGNAITPFAAQAGGPPSSKRLSLANLITRGVATLVVLPWLTPLANLMIAYGETPARAAIDFHMGFNVVASLVALPLADALARLTTRLMPDPPAQAEAPGPRWLDDSLIDQPSEALASALREVLRAGDKVEAMLVNAFTAIDHDDAKLMKQVGDADDEVDKLYEAIKHYLVKVSRNELSGDDARRYVEILAFATNLEHAGDIIDKNLMELAAKKMKARASFSPEGREDIRLFHAQVLANVRLALNVFATGDVALARRLLKEKGQLRETERLATESHFARLRAGKVASFETSAIHLDIIRDLRRINSHVASVAYQVLEAAGEPPRAQPQTA